MSKVIKVRNFSAGYVAKTEEFNHKDDPDLKEGQTQVITSAYTPDGLYIGPTNFAKKLVADLGIKPELANETDRVCTIGFSEKFQKWYGWSNLAVHGFGIGDKVEAGDITTTSGWTDEHLKKHPKDNKSLPVGFEAKTLEDAKKMAIAFADAVG